MERQFPRCYKSCHSGALLQPFEESPRGKANAPSFIALFANIVIAIAKLIGGLVSGSTGMLAEAAHSAADSVNEIFLAVGFYRACQPADARHPLGHGRERFLWSFMAAIASFLIWRLLVRRDGHCTT